MVLSSSIGVKNRTAVSHMRRAYEIGAKDTACLSRQWWPRQPMTKQD